MGEEFEWAFSPTDGEKLKKANVELTALRQQVKIAREALRYCASHKNCDHESQRQASAALRLMETDDD